MLKLAKLHVHVYAETDGGSVPLNVLIEQPTQLDPVRECYGVAWLLVTLLDDARRALTKQVGEVAAANKRTEERL